MKYYYLSDMFVICTSHARTMKRKHFLSAKYRRLYFKMFDKYGENSNMEKKNIVS